MRYIVTCGKTVVVEEGEFLLSKPRVSGEHILLPTHLDEVTVVVCAEPIDAAPVREVVLATDFEAQRILAAAVEVAHWYNDHNFCPRCGHRTRRLANELAMVCDKCRYRSYPRLSPCIIVMVTKGNQILLGNHHRTNNSVYTVLAGFIEVGETVESATIREISEEAGIQVDNVRYLGSQSWPFPGQFMIAVEAEWQGGDLTPDRDELKDLAWFDKASLPDLPPYGTISRYMIDLWLERS